MNQLKQHPHAWIFQSNPKSIAMLQTLMVRNPLMEGHSPFRHAHGCTYAICIWCNTWINSQFVFDFGSKRPWPMLTCKMLYHGHLKITKWIGLILFKFYALNNDIFLLMNIDNLGLLMLVTVKGVVVITSSHGATMLS